MSSMLRSGHQNGHTFNDVICDDLCELLLSYLSFEEKIRLEFVCRRFRHLVYNRQRVLRVENKSSGKDNLFKLMVKRDYYSNDKQILINKTAFESLLKKCKAIREIAISCEFNNREFALKTITKHCYHLSSISLNFHDISEHILKDFGHKFGNQMIAINFLTSSYSQIISTEFDTNYKKLIKLCPNLTTLTGAKMSYFIDESDVLVPKLKNLKMFYEESDEKLIDLFVQNYSHCLKSLHILNGIFWNENTLFSLLKNIKKIENLEELKLTSIKVKEYSPQMAVKIKNIGIKCLKLKNFCFSAQIESLIVSDLLKSITTYNNLRQLELSAFGSNFIINQNEEISVKLLQSSKQLTHLSLMSLNLSDNFFNDIHINLPQLSQLNISFNNLITNQTMNSLSKLKNISVLIIRASKSHIISKERIDEGMCQLIDNCSQLKSIQFFSRPNITHKTIDALIELALKRPKVRYYHMFADIDMRSKYNPYFTVIEIQNLPNNLSISTNF